MRDIPHFSPFKKHKRANYARHPSFVTFQETQTSELCETFLIFHPSRDTNERIVRDIPHFPPSRELILAEPDRGKKKNQIQPSKKKPLLAGTL